MEGAKSIEALTLCYTAGVVAGTLVSGAGQGAAGGAALMVLALSPVLFRTALKRSPDTLAIPILLAAFVMAGWFSAHLARIGYPESSALEGFALKTADRLRTFIDTLPFPHAETPALLKALLTGDRSPLSPETVGAFRRSGASHLLALSGLHMGILYLLLDWFTRAWGHTRAALRIRAALLISAAAFFTLMTGASPSLVRAFLFITLSEVLRLTGRPRKATRTFCLALLIQLVLWPAAIGSLGFQLSYLAVAGIILLYPVLESWYPEGGRFNPLRRIWQAAALSISCQVFTAPLVWWRFHTFPTFFLLTNLVAIPITTALMGTAVLTIALGAVNLCPAFLYTATDGLCRLLTYVLEVIASLS